MLYYFVGFVTMEWYI